MSNPLSLPWRVSNDATESTVVDVNGNTVIGAILDEDLAAHVVQCVNARDSVLRALIAASKQLSSNKARGKAAEDTLSIVNKALTQAFGS